MTGADRSSVIVDLSRRTMNQAARLAMPVLPYANALRITMSQLKRHALARAGALAVVWLAMVGVFADFLASPAPLLCRFQGHVYVLPALTPRTSPIRNRDHYQVERTREDWAIFPPVGFGPEDIDPKSVYAPPLERDHLLGTDGQGRDVLSRIVYGARTSITAGFFGMLAFAGIGIVLGALAGFFGGTTDAVITRLMETLSAIPSLVLVLVVQALLPQASTYTLVLTIVATQWTDVARLVRAEVHQVLAHEYVLAARALGLSSFRILRRHVLPNAIAPAVVAGTVGVATIVLIESSLGFLRVGLPKDTASWGEILSQCRARPDAWWLIVFPGLCVFVTVVSLNLVGEALRDALDPRLRDASESTAPPPREVDRESALPTAASS